MKKQRRRDISSEAKPLGKYGEMRRKLKIDPIRLWARDRRLAAVHEAGHAVIERVLGVPVGLAYVYLTPDRDLDPLCCRTWLGRTHYASKLANSRQRAMIAVAGAVAELAWLGEPIDADFWFEPARMSASDWGLAQCDPGNPDDRCIEAIASIEEVLARGASHWPNLLKEARRLIINSRVILRANYGTVHARPLYGPGSSATVSCSENG